MDICLSLALSSMVVLRVPSPLTLSWQHSVEHFRLEEDWAAGAAGLVLREARTQGLGAGVDVPPDATLADGHWRFTPTLPPQAQVHLANSRFAGGYRLCWSGQCVRLADLTRDFDGPITMAACP